MGILVGSWFFCIQHLPCSVGFGACSEVVWRFKGLNIPYRLREGQTNFGMPRGAITSLVVNELNRLLFI